MKRAATAAERRYLDRVAQLPCSVCGQPGPSVVHHPRFAAGAGERASHWLAIALCPECHQGKHGIHGDRAAWRLRKMEEADALANTIRGLAA